MGIVEHRCKRCGGDLQKINDANWKCPYCGSKFDDDTAQKYTRTLQDLFDESKQEMISNLRRNLYDAVTADYISSSDVLEKSNELKKYLPDDFAAKFFAIAAGNNVRALTQHIRNIDVKANYEEMDMVIDFLVRSIQPDFLLDLNNLVERTYKMKDLARYEEYATKISKEASRVVNGVYETKLPRDVFVAYSSRDMKLVVKLVEELESQGLKCFVSARNLRHGIGSVENYDIALKEAMDNCKCIVFVSTPNSRNLSCDALKVELPYVKNHDLENCPLEYRNKSYTTIPHEYKKNRVELRVAESTRYNAADDIVNEFFDGYERVYTPKAVAKRVMEQIIGVDTPPVAPPIHHGYSEPASSGTGSKGYDTTPASPEGAPYTAPSAPPKKKKKNGGAIVFISLLLVAAIVAGVIYWPRINGDNKPTAESTKPQTSDRTEPAPTEEREESSIKETEKETVASDTETEPESEAPSETEAPVTDYEVKPGFLLYSNTAKSDAHNIVPYSSATDMVKLGNGMYRLTASQPTAHSGIWNIDSSVNASTADYPVIMCVTKNLCTCQGSSCGASENANCYLMTGSVTNIAGASKYTELGVASQAERVGTDSFLYFVLDLSVMRAAGERINGMCFEFTGINVEKEGANVFDICYIAAFTSVAEADAHFKAYLSNGGDDGIFPEDSSESQAPETTEAEETTSPEPDDGMEYVDGFTLSDNGNDTYTVVGFDNYSVSEIAIPSVHKGKPVTVIGSKAFYQHGAITRITIPDSITKIESNAFAGCTALESIEIPTSVVNIGLSAFAGCTKLESITVPFVGNLKDGNTNTHFAYIFGATAYTAGSKKIPASLKNVTIIGGNTIANAAFYELATIESVVIQDGVHSIGNSTFWGCKKMTTFEIGANVKSIGDNAFRDCSGLGSIEIPDGLTTIGNNAFYGCSSILEINVPDSVTSMGAYVFYGCSSLETAKLSKGCTSMGNSTFDGCKALKQITIPENVTSISSYAFRNCTALETVIFGGTAQQWARMAIGTSNDCLKNAEIIYSYGEGQETTSPAVTDSPEESVSSEESTPSEENSSSEATSAENDTTEAPESSSESETKVESSESVVENETESERETETETETETEPETSEPETETETETPETDAALITFFDVDAITSIPRWYYSTWNSENTVEVVDGEYIRFANTGSTDSNFDENGVLLINNGTEYTGKYIIIKYRSSTKTQLQMYVSTEKADVNAVKLSSRPIISDENWHVVVTDLAAIASSEILPDAEGRYSIKTLRIDALDPEDTNCYFDLAYVALCEDIGDVYRFLPDGDMAYCQHEIYGKNENDEVECVICGEIYEGVIGIHLDATALAEISFHGNDMDCFADPKLAEDRSYVRYSRIGSSHDGYLTLLDNNTIDITGQYMIVKYRTDHMTTGQVWANTLSNGHDGGKAYFRMDFEADGEWHVAVIDLSEKLGDYVKPSDYGIFTIMWSRIDILDTVAYSGYFDLAYVTFCSNPEVAAE